MCLTLLVDCDKNEIQPREFLTVVRAAVLP